MQGQVRNSVMDAIGNTPVVRLGRVFPDAEVVAKLEYMNPGGSIKDRMVRHMLGALPDGTRRVVESSSGNTGAALAMASAVYGLDCDVTVPAATSCEKKKRIAAYGAKAHSCSVDDGSDYHAADEEIARETGAFQVDQ